MALRILSFGFALGISSTVTPVQHVNADGSWDPEHTYPVRLGDTYCDPYQIKSCIDDPDLSTGCCNLIRERKIFPYESVSALVDLGMSILIPLLVLLIRNQLVFMKLHKTSHSAMGCVRTLRALYTEQFQLNWDILTALAMSLVLQNVFVDFLKEIVRESRPIYFALILWASVYPDDAARQHAENEASLSFPSGHSSTVAAGFALAIFILLDDVRRSEERDLAAYVFAQTGEKVSIVGGREGATGGVGGREGNNHDIEMNTVGTISTLHARHTNARLQNVRYETLNSHSQHGPEHAGTLGHDDDEHDYNEYGREGPRLDRDSIHTDALTDGQASEQTSHTPADHSKSIQTSLQHDIAGLCKGEGVLCHNATRMLCFLLSVPIMAVGASRITDMWHFAWDVVAGWLIGIGTAYVAFDRLTRFPGYRRYRL